MWMLTVFILINGAWHVGDELDGWGSRFYLTYEECERRRHYAEKVKSDRRNFWICTEVSDQSMFHDQLPEHRNGEVG